jgi:hypothetical protein
MSYSQCIEKDFEPKALPNRCFQVITWTSVNGGREMRCGAHKRKDGTCPNSGHHRERTKVR